LQKHQIPHTKKYRVKSLLMGIDVFLQTTRKLFTKAKGNYYRNSK